MNTISAADIHSNFKKFKESKFKNRKHSCDSQLRKEDSFSKYEKEASSLDKIESIVQKSSNLNATFDEKLRNLYQTKRNKRNEIFSNYNQRIRSHSFENFNYADVSFSKYNHHIVTKVFQNISYAKLNRIFWTIASLWILVILILLVTFIGYPIGYPNYYKETGYKCLSCPSIYYFDSTRMSCIGKCSSNSFWNGTNCGKV